MKILLVGIKNGPQFNRLHEEAIKKGHTLSGAYVSEITILSDRNSFVPSLNGEKLTQYDLVYLVTVSNSRRWIWNAAVEYLSKNVVLIVNKNIVSQSFHYNPNVAKEYLELFSNHINFPKTLSFVSSYSIDMVLKEFEFPFIVKSGEGRKGRSVFKISNKAELEKAILNLEKNEETIVTREFIPNDGDIRVFTINGKALGAMRRTPREGEFRSNVAQGGTADNFDLSKNIQVKEIAEKAARATQIDIAGVDVMINSKTGEPFILEVNPGPQFGGFEKSTGINVAEKIIEYFESLQK